MTITKSFSLTIRALVDGKKMMKKNDGEEI